MIFNWGYLGGQFLMLTLSASVAAGLLVALRFTGLRTGPLHLWIELPAIGALLFLLGTYSVHMGWGRFLPHPRFPWTIGIGLAFYWGVLWWPLRVWWLRPELAKYAWGRRTLGASLLAPLVGIWCAFVEPQRLEAEAIELVQRDVGSLPIRIAHVSDTQIIGYGRRERALIRAVNEFDPHLILLTGDYISDPISAQYSIPAMQRILKELRASHGIYTTTGDSDSEGQRKTIFRDLPVEYLVNRSTTVDVEGVQVRIGGLDHRDPDWQRMASGAREDELFLVGCHSPDLAEPTGEKLPQADLYFCGHTHGGQIQIPFFGPPVTMCRNTSRRVAAGGVFETTTGMPLLLSRGVGMEGDYAPRIRFNCRPHVFLLTLRGTSRVE